MNPVSRLRRVLVVESDYVRDQGLRSLLGRQADFEVIAVRYSDEKLFLQYLTRTQPEVVVLNENGPLTATRISELLEMQPLASIRVILVRAAGNLIDVYERQRVTVTESGDLIELVRRVEHGI